MKAREMDVSTKQDPRKMSGVQLARLGVEILNKHDLVLQCANCGEIWTPQQNRDGKLAAGYWICPNKCNI
jgi:hypothetical protein